MTILNVPGIHCGMCVQRITKALTAQGFKFEVSLEDKTVSIDGGPEQIAKAKQTLDDLGFDAGEA